MAQTTPFLNRDREHYQLGIPLRRSKLPGNKQAFVSQKAEGFHLWYRRFSRELVVKVGYRRFWLHQTMYELYDWLTQDLKIAISEREILNVIGDFLALLRAGQEAKVREKLRGLKDLVIGLDARLS